MNDVPDFDEMNSKLIEEYRANGGKVGGPFAGESLILLHHVGAKSGIERVSLDERCRQHRHGLSW